jgi:hypothetical protein
MQSRRRVGISHALHLWCGREAEALAGEEAQPHADQGAMALSNFLSFFRSRRNVRSDAQPRYRGQSCVTSGKYAHNTERRRDMVLPKRFE